MLRIKGQLPERNTRGFPSFRAPFLFFCGNIDTNPVPNGTKLSGFFVSGSMLNFFKNSPWFG